MRYLFEHFGVAVGAISGVLAAEGKRMDLFGVTVLALVTAVGGGTARDLMLQVPVFWIVDYRFVLNGTLAATLTFLLAGRFPLPLIALEIADAATLALFAILGTSKALTNHASPVNAILLGVMTGVAGGIARDVLIGRIPLVFRDDTYLYATAATIGAGIFLLLNNVNAGERAGQVNLIIAIAFVFAIRLAAMRWKITLPSFNPQRKK